MRAESQPHNSILWLLYTLMVLTLSATMAAALLVDLGLFSLLIVTAGVSTAVAACLFFPPVRYGALGLLALTGLGVFALFHEQRLRLHEATGHLVFNLLDHLRGREIIFPENARMLWLILVGMTALLTAVAVFRLQRTWPVLAVYGGCFLLYWYSHVDLAYPMMAVFLVLHLIHYSLRQQNRMEPGGSRDRHEFETSWRMTALCYGLIIVLLAVLLPKNAPLVEWHWLEARMVSRFPVLVDLRGDYVYSRGFGRGDYFDFRLTGYQEDAGQLGGPVLPNDRLVMMVKAPAPLYLRGNVKTAYRDNSWHRDPANARIQDIRESFPLEVGGNERIRLEITNVNFSSMTLFAPYQPVAVESRRYGEVWVDNHYQLSFPDAVYKNESYTVHAAVPSPGRHAGSVSDLPDRYLQLPDTVTERVAELARRITLGITDPAEKALALQQYLRTRYPYSLDVPHTPAGQDFVDFFLFDSREGYCTYFATALAVMLRLEGIPSRYVEGYLMPPAGEEGVYEIRQRHAHTWVEAFVDSAGWITLEATPAYAVPEMLDLMGTGAYEPDGTGDDFDEFLLLTESMAQAQEAATGREGAESAPDVTDQEREGAMPEGLWLFRQLSYAAVLLLAALFLLFLARVVHRTLRWRIYAQQVRQLPVNSQAVHFYRYILYLLKAMGYPIEPGETPYEYAERITRQLYDREHHFNGITQHYILAQYSATEIVPEAIDRMADFGRDIDQRVRHHRGIRQYLYLKYIRSDYVPTFLQIRGNGR